MRSSRVAKQPRVARDGIPITYNCAIHRHIRISLAEGAQRAPADREEDADARHPAWGRSEETREHGSSSRSGISESDHGC